jgi:hypothetical protein
MAIGACRGRVKPARKYEKRFNTPISRRSPAVSRYVLAPEEKQRL